MEHINSSMSTDKEELKKTLLDLEHRKTELQEQIKNFSHKDSGSIAFNPIEHYQDDLKNVKGLIDNIKFYINKGKTI